MSKSGLLLWALAAAASASTVQTALQIPNGSADKLDAQAAFLARLLKGGGAVYYRLPEDALPSRDAKGQWRPEPLQAALRSQVPLAFRGDLDAASKGLQITTEPLPGDDEGRWLFAAGLPKVTLVEDNSTVSPLSKGLKAWNWPFESRTFAQVEADPRGALAAGSQDLVVFSSPGWWEDFANPPGGPSRMPKKVAEALRDFVRQGGSALFIDIAQWDLESAWPKSLDLVPLGPYQVSRLDLDGGGSGGVSLAPVGDATDKLRAKGAFRLLGSESFDYPDGGARPVYAAYAMPDPGGGQGWVAGLALHVFEQDEALAGKLRRLLLNLLLLSGNRRLSTQGEPKAPTPAPASPTRTPRRSPTPSPTASDSPTTGPSATPSASPPPTAAPTAVPTPLPTAVPTLRPTLAPTPLPLPLPTPRAALRATPLPALPTPRPTPPPVPTALPTTPAPRPTPRPIVTLARPTPLLTLAPPTARPTPRPTTVPTRHPTPRPAKLSARSKRRIPTVEAATPLPTEIPSPRPTVVLEQGSKNSLGCLETAPEPFGEGGVYLKFCLARASKAQVRVYDSQGRPLWQSPLATLEAGNQQVHFDGRANGHDLVPGRYLWEVRVVHPDGHAEERQGALTRKRRERRP